MVKNSKTPSNSLFFYFWNMDFFTKIDISQSDFKIDYNSNLFFMGSCFAENIYLRFTERKFHTFANPFGVVYNPLSIESQIAKIVEDAPYTDQDIFFDGEMWNCWDAHSSCSNSNRDQCIKGLNETLCKSRNFLKETDVVFITLGTAFVYFLKETGKVVSNCHKQNATCFDRHLISVDEAASALNNILAELQKIKRDIHVVFTVSPLRHLNDGAHGNNLSKSTLLLAIEKAGLGYFPSYEIVMDELRDYRFYANDMTHLSSTAEDYIFERMEETFCTPQTITHTKQVEKLMKMANHRIVNPGSAKAESLTHQITLKAAELERLIPGFKF